ncbi:ABC transporter ATP-binding protein [Azorhizobium oxalatiphilum]|uniref:ABC transporter ATP-binding protein n=1 Tax=Azorhizobium oxalatiphilum TaxID=980631 RepID=A0A917BTS0_9HYPH|nr:ABC transporter ATP-binding protein [Azorhizobium oxalatiphilum]GGF58432.1 ABC transporter ATP-binding protein [Azorhizobium oxalatiphilum]
MSLSDVVLAAHGVGVRFGGFTALQDASVAFRRGAITGVVGPNGAGKSTLFNILSGRVRPTSGAVLYKGEDITRLPGHARARRGLTRTFQISRELGGLTVLENLLLATPGHPGEGLVGGLFGGRAARAAEEQARVDARGLLERVGLWRLADASASALSGGQKKLLELCRALMLRPEMILLDEPAAGVNPVLIGEVADFIRVLQSEGVSFGIVEHNMDLIAALCDPIYVLAEGRVLLEGSFEAISANEAVIEAYLGGVH